MTRKKVKLAFITNDSARKATFKKRKKGLMKKVSELSTLCGIDACAIVYSPYDPQPEIWPSPLGVQRVLAQFKRMPEMEQCKKMVNQESFLRQRIVKAKEQLKKQQKDNREKEVTQIMFQSLTGHGLQNLNMIDLNDLGWLVDHNLKEIHNRQEALKERAVSQVARAEADRMVQSTVNVTPEKAPTAFDATVENMQRQQWFMELMNSNEQMNFGGDDMMLPFGDNNPNSSWSNSFFPWDK
ncbi:hypothetical protein L1049_021057 [Liquidambar formosana]|uniref:MADS-box domain-containing protein n=1 Tax=Liquidambar formosana TaxID=63359 RepID=A0AAP0S8R4_LIQFO